MPHPTQPGPDGALPGRPLPERHALIVRGGWEGHQPVECTELFRDHLQSHGFTIETCDDLEIYADAALLASTDLIVQCWTDGRLTEAQEYGLMTAVANGTGFAGWHGGVVATFHDSLRYQYMVGGHFVAHPGDLVDYGVEPVSDHEVIDGIEWYEVQTEQYFCHVDPTLSVHATTTFVGAHGAPETAGALMPVVWTRNFRRGRVFVCTLGHSPADLQVPETRAIVERGLLWAASDASMSRISSSLLS